MPSSSPLLSSLCFLPIRPAASLLLSVSRPYYVKQQQQQQQQQQQPRSHSYLFLLLLVLTSLCSPLCISASPALPHSISISGSSFQQPSQANHLAAALEPELGAGARENLVMATLATTTTQITSISKSTMAPTSSSSSASSTSLSSAAAVSSSTTLASPAPTMRPDTGDNQLFGRPSVIGGYNLTLGILICSSITLVFLITIAIATFKRAQLRKRFRIDEEKSKLMEAGRVAAIGKNGKGGKGGDAKNADVKDTKPEVKEKDTSRDAVTLPSRQASIRRALLEDARRENEARARTQENKLGGQDSPIDRNGSFKRQQQPQPQPRGDRARNEMNTRFQDHEVNYDDVYQDDYSLPPLTASSTDDAYYSGGFSNAIQAYHYDSPQIPNPAYQQQQPTRPLQPVKRTGSGRSSNGNAPALSAKSINRVPSLRNERPRPKVSTQGFDNSGSRSSSRSNSSSGSNVSSPVDRIGQRFGRGGGSPVAQIEMDSYPSPVARSNSSRLPFEMRGASASGHGQAQNGRLAGAYIKKKGHRKYHNNIAFLFPLV
ncbi:hypothetical protein BGX20_009368 [Mortierella sp. AD010]|nr:hypothetical protein BGX20_009368 [Mortierella sp. AD010]